MTTKNALFKVGHKAVYPGHGVGEVLGIETKTVAGQEQTFYVLRILDNGPKIFVPTASAHAVGLREIMSKQEVDEVLKILKKKKKTVTNTHQTWNRRYREYMEKIKTGSIQEIAEVLRDLYLLKYDKDLSFGERKMLDTARNLLIKELSLAMGETEDEVENRLGKIFKAELPVPAEGAAVAAPPVVA